MSARACDTPTLSAAPRGRLAPAKFADAFSLRALLPAIW